MDRHRGGGGGGDAGRHSRMSSRWSSSGSPTHGNHRYPRGVGAGGGGGGGGGEGFSSGAAGGGGGSGGGGGRYHPYRGPPEYPPPSGGFRGAGAGGSPVDFGGPPMPISMPGPRRGFSGRGGSPDHNDVNTYAKLFIGSVPRTATEEDIRPLFEEHGDVIEVALIKDRKTGQQQGCCFIKYATSEEADRAIRALHNQYTLPGGTGPIQVRYADGERERHGAIEHKLFVASLNKQATPKEVEEIFAPYGHVEDVYIMRDGLRQSRGCGFVKFSTREMAAAAMNTLNGTYVMRGCDQPLIVRFADPKRPRPGESRGGPAFGGPGFSPRSEAALVIRPTDNLDESRGRRMPPDSWQPLSPPSMRPQFSNHGSDNHSTVKGGAVTSTDTVGTFGPTSIPPNGSLSSHSSAPSSFPQMGFNPSMTQVRPIAGQQISPLQKSLVSPQSFPSSLQLHNTQQMLSYSQGQNLQAPMQQLSQLQVPQSIGMASFSQTLPSQKLPGLGGPLPTSQTMIQQNPTATALQTPGTAQQQPMPTMSNQQQFSSSNISPQLLQQPMQQLPSQIPQVMLQQQAQALQSSFQSSQQAILQLQQQLQMMQQQSNLNQQQATLATKQQSWGGPVATSNSASAPNATVPTTLSATPSLPVITTPAIQLTCNWSEHSSPEGFKYYYNSATRESKWEKPEEFVLYEQQQQQQQKLLLLQQQQQKLSLQQLQSPSHTQSHTQIQPTQQVPQMQQGQPPMQMRHHGQLHILQPSVSYQASAAAGQQNTQDSNYAQLQGSSSAVDLSRVQQGIQAAQEWAWKNKPAGS